MPAPDINEMTLDELRPIVAAALPADAAFDGWTDKALASTAARLGLKPEIAALLFPGGAFSMVEAWFRHVDAAMLKFCPAEGLTRLKVRERIIALVEARMAVMAPDREALRRAQAVLAMPHNTPKAIGLGWQAADAIWKAAGDTATDYNHYTKRAILGSVYAATMLVFVNDETPDYEGAKAFLARRIEGVMRFEKAKARLTSAGDRHFSIARFLGRLRYPAK